MKRTAYYIAGPYLALTENWIYEQIRNLSRYSPVIYCHFTENLDAFGGYKIRTLGARGGLGNPLTFFTRLTNGVFRFNPIIASFMLRDRPDVLHAHFGPAGYFCLGQRRVFGIPLVTTFYGYDATLLPETQPEWRKRFTRLFDGGDLFLAEGSRMRERLVELGCPRQKVEVNHLGVDTARIASTEKHPSDDGCVKVLVCGSFTEKKGIPYAVRAFGAVAKRRTGRPMILTIVGDSTGTAASEAVKGQVFEAIRECRLEGAVRMMGFQGREFFLEELRENHILLAPSVTAANGDAEGGAPVVITEASASGMPVIATTHSDIPEVVIDGMSGYLVPERDVEALAGRLAELVDNPDSWPAMGKAGREHVEQEYDAVRQAGRLEEIYDRLLGAG